MPQKYLNKIWHLRHAKVLSENKKNQEIWTLKLYASQKREKVGPQCLLNSQVL